MPLQLCFTPVAAPVCIQHEHISTGRTRRASRPKFAKKPRAPPRFAEHRSTPRRWRAADEKDALLRQVTTALNQWYQETGHPKGSLPSDSHLRRCEIARRLRLQRLVTRAGGHRAVQASLGLRPIQSSLNAVKEKELAELAQSLYMLCADHDLVHPSEEFPDKKLIRKLSPPLGNRIAAFPGRNGYNRLAEYIRAKANKSFEKPVRDEFKSTKRWGLRTNPHELRMELLAYQTHPQVLPRLNSLPSEIAGAIQRQGGAAVFARAHGMVLDRDWGNLLRFSGLIRWLSDQVFPLIDVPNGSNANTAESYLLMVQYQMKHPPNFPSPVEVARAGFTNDVLRYGGRKSLAGRLGFSRTYGIRDVFMGPFSVLFAADLLEHAVKQVHVSADCSIAMPAMECMVADGRSDLAGAVGFLGGEGAVGRRVGLVPRERLLGNVQYTDYA
ncbi:unnamed protein product [Chondrus crispus]|uniref:Uncharacterized protein n=1 Tax=Chondrus crispus TaxID=2769 RepID=R7QJB7_CHOCR|nr:unnamed protein product [Chondrus crispus]CDF37485.1 unnamed protein product [Chondrus crispus]|eukprot:XP_005717356.1 unnamed protein product [Chondrus crispus]